MTEPTEKYNANTAPIYLTDGREIPEELFQRITTVQNSLRDSPPMATAFSTYLRALVSPQMQFKQLTAPHDYNLMVLKALMGIFSMGARTGYMAANQAIDVDRFLAEFGESIATAAPDIAAMVKAGYESGALPQPGPRYPRTEAC